MIGAIGAASELWQALRSQQSTTASSTPADMPQPTSTTSAQPATPAATATSGPDTLSKLVTDVKSLLLSLQSGSAGDTTSTSTTAGTTSATTSAASQVQSDLDQLSNGPGGTQTGATHPHHHHHHGGIHTDATGATPAQLASTDPGLLDAVSKAITAYRASGTSAASPT